MEKLQSIKIDIENILKLINQPISEDEKTEGWVDENRKTMINYLNDLLERLNKNPHELTHHDGQIARNMDHLGIIGGDILEKVAGISNDIRQYMGED